MRKPGWNLALCGFVSAMGMLACSSEDTKANSSQTGGTANVDGGDANVGTGGAPGQDARADTGQGTGGQNAGGTGGSGVPEAATPDASPDVLQDASSDGSLEATPNSPLDATFDGSPEAAPDASPDASPDTDANEGGATASDGGLAIAWSAFLPLAAGVSSGAAGTTPDATEHHYDATYPSTGITFADSSMVFGGGEPIVSIPAQAGVPVVDLAADYSISVWVNMTNANEWRTFVSADGANVSEFYIQKRKDTGRLAFTLAYSDTDIGALNPCSANSAIIPSANTLYHLVATRNAATGVDVLYVDGAESGRQTCAVSEGVGWNASTFGVGYGRYGGNSVDYFLGTVSGLGFVNRVLTPTEVAALHALGPAYVP